MFMLKSTHERIVARLERDIDIISHKSFEQNTELTRYRAQRDAANKRRRDARKAAKVAK